MVRHILNLIYFKPYNESVYNINFLKIWSNIFSNQQWLVLKDSISSPDKFIASSIAQFQHYAVIMPSTPPFSWFNVCFWKAHITWYSQYYYYSYGCGPHPLRFRCTISVLCLREISTYCRWGTFHYSQFQNILTSYFLGPDTRQRDASSPLCP